VAGTEGCARRSLIGSSPSATSRGAGAGGCRPRSRGRGAWGSAVHGASSLVACGDLAGAVKKWPRVRGSLLVSGGTRWPIRRRWALQRCSHPTDVGTTGGRFADHSRVVPSSSRRSPTAGHRIARSARTSSAAMTTASFSGKGATSTLVTARPGSGAAGARRPGSSAAALSMPLSDHGRFAPTPCRAAPAPHLPPSADRFPDDEHPPRPHPDRSASSAPAPPVRSRHPPPARPHATTRPEATPAPLRTTTGAVQRRSSLPFLTPPPHSSSPPPAPPV
jgi:hypothetical protein